MNVVNAIKVRGARVHNLKNINVDVPLNQIVGIAGISGSGKSSLALGVLYAEGVPSLFGGAVNLYQTAYDAGSESSG